MTIPEPPQKIPVSVRLDATLLAQLDQWCEAQVVETTRTAVLEAALRIFLVEYTVEQ